LRFALEIVKVILDSEQLARSLYETFKSELHCFLDRENLSDVCIFFFPKEKRGDGTNCFFQLGDLLSSVKNSSYLLLILSENIFKSKFCLLELKTAIENGVEVILIQGPNCRFGKHGQVPILFSFSMVDFFKRGLFQI